MNDRDVAPDASLLRAIFPEDSLARISIILQNWDKCVFKAEFSNGQAPCVVRLETQKEGSASMQTVAAMQRLASTQIPNLIPDILATGAATNDKGRSFQFCVVQYVEGQTLEEVWEEMSEADQRHIVTSLADAIKRLQSVRLSDDTVRARLCGVGLPPEALLGGPWTGFLADGPALLEFLTRMQQREAKQPPYEVEPCADPKGTRLRSRFEDLGSITVEDHDMAQWSGESVLCHNDLTPRNLIVRPSSKTGEEGGPRYQLAAIIDWEVAGFYPASYQLSLQDTYLSSANRHISLYLLLKQHLKELVPRSPSQIALLHAMEFVYESRQKRMAERGNIPALIRQKFRKELRLARDEDPYTGWICDTREGPAPRLSASDIEKIETDVIKAVTG
ncbi:hypothetical protein GGTG_01156 [Gaeumannomyces tritici R3-111a-1]|uniref:Aminoglycoside phosphotransferase domain-containing protein n=1 Tax=Gaeumannomyces tritici (strain R3-111a-1) TaxID=644352 RepID=J3NIS2_GAET3|nr:hypothetical protein GGTG_01156 [Gaeumannomyces tritici R3-111a-1]EJT81172.1 hypothetical protein GGTG_01156 [Gaeumannomyces tritici R3-111a-1]